MKILTRQEELVLLSIYQLQGNSCLAVVRDFLIENTGKEWSVSSVFVPMDRLTREGYLKEEIKPTTSKRGGRPTKYYVVTEEGLNALTKLKELNATMWKGLEGLAT